VSVTSNITKTKTILFQFGTFWYTNHVCACSFFYGKKSVFLSFSKLWWMVMIQTC